MTSSVFVQDGCAAYENIISMKANNILPLILDECRSSLSLFPLKIVFSARSLQCFVLRIFFPSAIFIRNSGVADLFLRIRPRPSRQFATMVNTAPDTCYVIVVLHLTVG